VKTKARISFIMCLVAIVVLVGPVWGATRSLTNLLSGVRGGVGLCADPASRDHAYFVEYNAGTLRRVNLSTGAVSTVATGLSNPVDVAIAGRTAYVTEGVGRLTSVRLDTGEKATVVSGLASPQQIALRITLLRVALPSADTWGGGVVPVGLGVEPRIERIPAEIVRPRLRLISQAYVVEHGSGKLTCVDLLARSKSEVKSGLGHPVGVVLEGNIAYVSEQDGGKISRIDLSTGRQTTVVSGLSQPFFLYKRHNRQGLFVTERGAQRLSYVDIGLNPTAAKEVASGLSALPSGILVSADESKFYVATDAALQKAVLRSSFVEIDCMAGTAFPPNGLSHAGEIATLEGIYLEAAMMVDVRHDEDSVANLAGADNIFSDAELDALMAAHRNPAFAASGERWSAHLIVVNGIYTEPGPGWETYGVMFDTTDRQGCAVFYGRALISGEPKAFLRTSAHELGHEFNCLHSFGDGTSSIMTRTGDIDPFPDAISYHFTEVSKRHLREHPSDHVRPGGSAFASCPESHAP